MCIHGGYKTQTVTQVANLISSYDAGEITLRALRIYLAALVSVASREAAKRSRARVKRRREVTPRFLISELSRLTGLPECVVKNGFRLLKKQELLTFGETEISFSENSRVGSHELLSDLAGNRSPLRPVPVPRTLLRFLARCTKASTIKTALAYAVRGLTLSRRGEITGKGSIKATSIANTMAMSERSARSARAELLSIGFITDDEGSIQRKLNRTGAYFTVNLLWKEPKPSYERVINRGGSEGTIKSPAAEGVSPVDNSGSAKSKFAPPGAKNRTLFAPPYKDKKTLFRSKNQETHPERLNPSGLCTAKNENQRPRVQAALPPPNIRDVRPEDLKSFGRVEELYRQAVKVRLIEPTEANAINFIGAAARATRVEGDAPRIFMGIIRGKLWKNISDADEDRALAALRRYRAENPDRFRIAA